MSYIALIQRADDGPALCTCCDHSSYETRYTRLCAFFVSVVTGAPEDAAYAREQDTLCGPEGRHYACKDDEE